MPSSPRLVAMDIVLGNAGGDLGFGNLDVTDGDVALCLDEIAQLAYDFDGDLDGLSWCGGAANFGPSYGCEEQRLSVGIGNGGLKNDAGELGDGFDHEDAW